MSCVSVWADEISHTQHTTHNTRTQWNVLKARCNARFLLCKFFFDLFNSLCFGRGGRPIDSRGGNNLPNSCICTFEPKMVDFIDVVVLWCDLALMNIFPGAQLGLSSTKLWPYMLFTSDNRLEGAKGDLEWPYLHFGSHKCGLE